MSSGERIPYSTALRMAEDFLGEIAGACERIEIAGSIRRQAETCGDIEIVAVPSLDSVSVGLFADQFETIDLLDQRCVAMLEHGILGCRLDKNNRRAWGPKYKRLTYHGFALDLFTPPLDSFGVILAIRTGPTEFSHALVSPKGARLPSGAIGMLPDQFRVHDGSLTYRISGQPIPTPTERGFFEMIGVPHQEPHLRGASTPPTAAGGASASDEGGQG